MSNNPSKSKVSNFDNSLVVDEDILRFEVSVKHLFMVHVLNTLKYLL
jgi:hypothetical protein